MKPVKVSLVQERTSRSPAVSPLMFSRSRLAFSVCCKVILMYSLRSEQKPRPNMLPSVNSTMNITGVPLC